MTDIDTLLKAAKEAESKATVSEEHLEVIAELRNKDYSWRDIANFFCSKGVEVEHTKISRLAKANFLETNISQAIPASTDYVNALKNLKLSDEVMTMLKCHYNMNNRTVTYGDLAHSIGKDDYRVANKIYGDFAKKLCEQLNFIPFQVKSGRPYYGSVIGMEYTYAAPKEKFQLVMHHELSKALEELNIK